MNKTFLKILSVFSFICMFMFNVNVIGEAQNNNRPKVSIIVPVYNVEKWLPECMDSLINQTLEDIEIICIDDGSPDNCGKILDEYAEKDKEKFKRERIKVIHQENQGVSVARNSGLDIASGEYISFVDSDDYVHPKTYETAYKWAKKSNVDLLRFNHRNFDDGKDNFDINDIDLSDGPILSLEEYLKNDYANYTWGHLFKSNLIQDDNIRFTKDVIPADDTCFNYRVFANVKSVKHIPGKFYNYRHNRFGQITSDKTKWNMFPLLKHVVDHWRKVNKIKGNEELLLCTLIRWMGRHEDVFIARSQEVLEILKPDLYNEKIMKKCPQKIKKRIKKLERNAQKQRKMKKAA